MTRMQMLQGSLVCRLHEQRGCKASFMQNCMCLSGDARQQDFFGGKLLSTWVLPKLMWHVTYDIADQRMRFRMSAQKLVPLQSQEVCTCCCIQRHRGTTWHHTEYTAAGSSIGHRTLLAAELQLSDAICSD